MKIEPSSVSEYLLSSYTRPRVTIDDAIKEIITILSDKPLSKIQLGEILDVCKPVVIKDIKKYLDECYKKRTFPKLRFGCNPEFIFFREVNYIEASNKLLKYISKMDPIKFERLCKRLLELQGYENVSVTPPRADGGIDFYATTKMEFAKIEEEGYDFVKVFILGQAKRYKKAIGIEDIRSFIGSLDLIKIVHIHKAKLTIKSPIKYDDFCPLAPIQLLFITSGNVTNSVKNVSKWLGLKIIEGHQIAEIFFNSNFAIRRLPKDVVFDPKDIESL